MSVNIIAALFHARSEGGEERSRYFTENFGYRFYLSELNKEIEKFMKIVKNAEKGVKGNVCTKDA